MSLAGPFGVAISGDIGADMIGIDIVGVGVMARLGCGCEVIEACNPRTVGGATRVRTPE